MNKTTRLKKPQIPELDTLYQFDDLGGRPKYGGVEMTSTTNIPSFDDIRDETHSMVVAEATARDDADEALQTQIDNLSDGLSTETDDRIAADNNLQSEIDAIVAASDVKDIVGTKAELNNYDTSTLGDNDIIKVLQDETQQDQTTYYRWSVATETFTLIGAEGPYYTKSQADVLLNAKQNTLTAGPNVQITGDTISATDTTYTAGNGLNLTGTEFSADTSVLATQTDLAGKQDTLTAGTNVQIQNNVISATDTTYSDFTGTDGTTAGAAGLVPAPATTDADKFLKADGAWSEVVSGAIELTSADYDYPDDSPRGVALWRLPAGIYYAKQGTYVYHSRSYDHNGTVTIIVSNPEVGNYWTDIVMVYPAAGQDTYQIYKTAKDTGESSSDYNNISPLFTDRIVQTAGTSTTNVMSQNATTSMVFADPATKRKIQIGAGSITTGTYSTAIGQYASSTATGSVAIGGGNNGAGAASATAQGSIALGIGAKASAVGEMNIGTTLVTSGYNSSNYRLLTGLYDGQSAHDAVTVGQLNTAIAGAGAAEINSTDWSALWQ